MEYDTYDEFGKAQELIKDDISYEASKVSYLKTCDELCSRCIRGDKGVMLCEGIRPFVSINDSNYTKKLKLIFKPCQKRTILENELLCEKRLEKSWIPSSMLAESKGMPNNISYRNIGFCKARLHNLTTRSHFIAVGHTIRQGYTARYVYVPALLNGYAKYLDNLSEDLVYYPDLLIVDCLDLAVGSKIRREAVISALEYRVSLKKDTIVGISSNPISDNPKEQEFYNEVVTWNEMKY